MQFTCSPRKLQILTTVVAVIIIISVLILLFLFNWPSFAKKRVIEAMLFKDGTLEMDRFETTSDLKNLRLTIYVYNLTNPQEVINSSAKMKLKEIGPFVYHEFKTREFMNDNQTSGMITYKLRRRFTFKPELSVSDPTKTNITWINIPVLSAIYLVEKMSTLKRYAARIILNRAISNVNEGPFITDSVENFIFDGSYRALFADPLLAPFIPDGVMPGHKFAILQNRNDTWLPNRDYIFTTSAGFGTNQTYRDLNQYKFMNGSSKLPFWKSDGHCNDLRGTDGEFFSPFLNASENLEVYSMDICRKLSLKFRGETSLFGINVFKYSLDQRSLQSGFNNPENQCYCIGNPATDCNLDGLIDLATCITEGVVASGSHFLYGDPELLDRVNGVKPPNATDDEPIIHVEPNTGLSIQVKVPLQINVRLYRNDGYNIFGFFKDIKPLTVPLLRVIEAADLTDEQASMLRTKLLILDSWFISMVLGGSIVFILVIIIVISVLCIRYRKTRTQVQEPRQPSESDPLLPRASAVSEET